MFKNYVWDFDGTLFDTYGPMEKALKETFEEKQLPLPKNIFYQILATSIRQVIKENVPEKNREDFQRLYQQKEKQYQKDPQPFADLHEVLKEIVKRGGKNFLYTHRDESTFTYLKKHHLESYFNVIITSRDHFKRKPNPEGLIYLLNHENLKAEETVMVGDRLLDIEFGENAGVHTIWFNSYRQPLKIVADFEVENLKEILTIGG